MATFSEACIAKDRLSKRYLNREDVVGLGVGYCPSKKRKREPGIILYVKSTFKTTKSTGLTRVRTKIKRKTVSIPMRIVSKGSIAANNRISSSTYQNRIRPMQGGYSVGYPGIAGTGGLIVIDGRRSDQLYICSNNHVLNHNNSPNQSVTLQPGSTDGGVMGRDRIGRLYQFVKLNKTNNLLDAATSIPNRNEWLSPHYAQAGTIPGHYRNYGVGWKFAKVGRTTGMVSGTVESVNTDIKVDYDDYSDLGLIQFKNQTVITSNMPISEPGDSGSVWLHARNRYATAVNYAGSEDGKLSISYPIHWFMQVFEARVAQPDNQRGSVRRPARSITNRSDFTHPLSKKQLNSIRLETSQI